MGNPEWAGEEIFKDRFIRGEYADALWPLMAEWTKDRNKQELFMAAQAKRIPLAPMNRPSDVYADEPSARAQLLRTATHARRPHD